MIDLDKYASRSMNSRLRRQTNGKGIREHECPYCHAFVIPCGRTVCKCPKCGKKFEVV